ncbi:MAG TPA: CheR family methyltransferase, partial [Acidobacteriota bacterium]|nr:CheR family methyltransferase [Acidobacteriota bacterium]
LREQVIFARQNFLSDPPFSHLDLICCRNLLIYLDGELQQRAIPTFHYALNPGGFLFLGVSESIGRFTDLFATIDGPHRIFMKQAAASAVPRPTGERSYQRLARAPSRGGFGALRARQGSIQRDAQREAERVILNRYAPPSVLIGPERQVLHFRGDVDGYFRIQPGRASFDLLKMAREGLQAPLRSALEQSEREKGSVRTKEIVVRLPGGERRLELEIVPLINLRECCRLILFHEANAAGVVRPIVTVPGEDSAGHVAQLEQELADARDYLQSIQELQEAAQQELEASNEEGQSANEELQSLVEELETSKEELQATNEELTTVNEELGQRLKQVSELNSDLNNLQTATNLAVVLLGPDLVVRRFTSPAKRLFGLHASDVGQPFRLASLPVAGLKEVVAAACAGVGETTHEMADEHGRWHSLSVRPYLNAEGAVDGAVLMMTDIDVLKQTEIRIAAEREHAQEIVQAVPSPLAILSAEFVVVSANDAFFRTFQLASEDAIGRSIFAMDNGVWENGRLRRLLGELSSQADFFSTLELAHHFPRFGARTLLIDARLLGVHGDRPREIVLSIQDVTDVLAFQVGLRRSELRYRRLFEA